MFFMDDLISGMLEMMPENLEYQKVRKLEGRLLGELGEAAGEELVGKLTDAQMERTMVEYRPLFLWGLRLGAEMGRV